ncbi:unnamed protein product, partial [Prunus brigantina]
MEERRRQLICASSINFHNFRGFSGSLQWCLRKACNICEKHESKNPPRFASNV